MERSGVVNVFISDHSPRASWIFKLIFEEVLGLSLHITTDSRELEGWSGAVLNYSDVSIPGIPAIVPSGILSETGIQQQDIEMSEYRGLPVFFMVKGGDLPFDPFAMAFYLVSRYEEYLPFEADDHGRYPHTESLAFKEGFLDIALVDRLSIMLGEMLNERFQDLDIPQKDYSFRPTIDIDIAYAHLGKGFIRTMGAMAKLLLKGDIKEINSRLRTMMHRADDPFDNFDFILDECRLYEIDPLFFVLAGDKSPNDRNLSLQNKRFASLIKDLDAKASIGIHPSYSSGVEPQRVGMEIERIEKVVSANFTSSGQHFVRLKFTDTYQLLIENCIEEDYSMGYAGISGFRAAMASPFSFYNLQAEKETSLKVFPFMFMDSTLSDYLGISPEQYLENVNSIIDEVKACNGHLIAIWHNYAISDNTDKKEAFKSIIKQAALK